MTLRHGMMGLALALALVWAGLGCSKAAEVISENAIEKAIESDAGGEGQDVDVNIKDGGVTLTSEDGKTQISIGENTTLPKGFPDDVPLYPGLQLLGSSAAPGTEDYAVQATSTDGIDKIAAYYGKELKSRNWEEERTMAMAMGQDMRILAYTKDGRRVHVTLHATDDSTMVSIHTGKDE